MHAAAVGVVLGPPVPVSRRQRLEGRLEGQVGGATRQQVGELAAEARLGSDSHSPNTSRNRSSIACHDRWSASSLYRSIGITEPSAAGLVKLCMAPP